MPSGLILARNPSYETPAIVQLMALLPLLAVDTDRQAAQAAEDYRRGQASTVGASAAHGRVALKIFCALP